MIIAAVAVILGAALSLAGVAGPAAAGTSTGSLGCSYTGLVGPPPSGDSYDCTHNFALGVAGTNITIQETEANFSGGANQDNVLDINANGTETLFNGFCTDNNRVTINRVFSVQGYHFTAADLGHNECNTVNGGFRIDARRVAGSCTTVTTNLFYGTPNATVGYTTRTC